MLVSFYFITTLLNSSITQIFTSGSFDQESDAVTASLQQKGVEIIRDSQVDESFNKTFDLVISAAAEMPWDIKEGGRLVRLTTKAASPYGIPATNVTVSTINFQSILNGSNTIIANALRKVMKVTKTVDFKPLSESIKGYSIMDYKDALIDLQKSEGNKNRIVLTTSPQDLIWAHSPIQRKKLSFSAEKAYLLVGCLGGLGRSLAKWMVGRGARHIVFLNRSGDEQAPAKAFVNDLKQQGVKVKVFKGDVASPDVTSSVVQQVQREWPEAPISGVLQAAMVLDDTLFADMSAKQLNKVLGPKVQGTLNLHNALKTSNLDFFVMFSSVCGIVGNIAQG